MGRGPDSDVGGEGPLPCSARTKGRSGKRAWGATIQLLFRAKASTLPSPGARRGARHARAAQDGTGAAPVEGRKPVLISEPLFCLSHQECARKKGWYSIFQQRLHPPAEGLGFYSCQVSLVAFQACSWVGGLTKHSQAQVPGNLRQLPESPQLFLELHVLSTLNQAISGCKQDLDKIRSLYNYRHPTNNPA